MKLLVATPMATVPKLPLSNLSLRLSKSRAITSKFKSKKMPKDSRIFLALL